MSEPHSSASRAPIPLLHRPLSVSVKRVLRLAADEARRLNHPFVGNEHLAAAMTAVDGRVAAALDRLGFKHEQLCASIAAELGEGEAAPGGAPRLNARAERSLAFAGDEAKRAARRTVGLEHLLIGMARDESLFGGLLSRLGLETERARTALQEARGTLAHRYADARAEAAAIIDEPLAAVQRAQRSVGAALERALRRRQRELAERLRATSDALQEIAERLRTAGSTVEPG